MEPHIGNPLVLVIAYLHRHALSLKEYLTKVFEQQAINKQMVPFSVACMKEVLLDSARGMTADNVHVIRASRNPGSHDQYYGIQYDANRDGIHCLHAGQVMFTTCG